MQQWTLKAVSKEPGRLGYSAYHWVTMALPSMRNLVEVTSYEQYLPLPPLAQIPSKLLSLVLGRYGADFHLVTDLKILRLVRSSLERPRKLVHPSPVATFPKLHHLTLIDSQYITMSTWADIADYINSQSFPALTSVTLALSKTSVRSLDRRGDRVRLVKAIAALPSLSSLEIGDQDDIIYKTIKDVWTEFGPTLTNLTLDYDADMLTSALAGLSHPLQTLTLLPPKLIRRRIRCYCACPMGLTTLLDALRSNSRSVSELTRVVMSVDRDEKADEVECHEYNDGEKVRDELVELLLARGVEVMRPNGEDRRLRPEEQW